MAPANSLAYTQLLTFGGAGGMVGYQIAKRIEPTSLPQAVAGFHVLVGIAGKPSVVVVVVIVLLWCCYSLQQTLSSKQCLPNIVF